MSILYDPLKRKPKVIVYIILGLIPLILLCFLLFGSKDLVKQYQDQKEQEETEDIFDRF
ncbi:MAG: hypothetical protein KC733_00465 [Candidatus Omnitrophica bacterium]|nr:hypothetical protein [Candidatus Omnitrophota bacterium]